MAIKLEKVKPGDVLMDVHRHRMGNTTMSEWGLWYVRVIEVDVPAGRALVSWNGNRPRWMQRRWIERLYTKEPKAYLKQQAERAERAAQARKRFER